MMSLRTRTHTNHIENCSPIHTLLYTQLLLSWTSLSPLCIENFGVYQSPALPLTKMASFTSPLLEPAAPTTSLSPSEPTTVARFVAPSGCAPHLREAYERAVNVHPAAWRREPMTGEVFKDLVEAERRLRCHALVAGFDIVRGSGGTTAYPGASFLCFYHGDRTLNTRGLEDSVIRDNEGMILSRRQRDSTSIRQRGCP